MLLQGTPSALGPWNMCSTTTTGARLSQVAHHAILGHWPAPTTARTTNSNNGPSCVTTRFDIAMDFVSLNGLCVNKLYK